MARLLDMNRSVSLGVADAAGSASVTTGVGILKTVVTVNTTLPAIAGGAALGIGKELCELPAGALRILGSYADITIQQTDGNIDADTPDVGLGTTIASGAVAVLSGTPAFENIMTGQTASDCDGAATVAQVATDLMIAAAGSHKVYLNVADTWAASGDAGAYVSGTVTILWAVMS